MTSGVIVGRIFFSSDQLLRVVQLLVLARSYFICALHVKSDGNELSKVLTDDCWFQVDHHRSGYHPPVFHFREEGAEGIVGRRRRGHAVRLNAMLQAVEFPRSISNLHSSLTYVNRYALPLKREKINTYAISRACIVTIFDAE